MRTWLHLFGRMHRQYFTMLATQYFKQKGLTMDSWLDSVINSQKEDVLTLLGLCMLTEQNITY